MEVGGSLDLTWYGKDASLNTYCGIVVRLVLEAEWKGFGDEYAVSGLEKSVLTRLRA